MTWSFVRKEELSLSACMKAESLSIGFTCNRNCADAFVNSMQRIALQTRWGADNRNFVVLFIQLKLTFSEMAGIYIHIPFCKQACVYCNFHFSTSMKLKNDFIQ